EALVVCVSVPVSAPDPKEGEASAGGLLPMLIVIDWPASGPPRLSSSFTCTPPAELITVLTLVSVGCVLKTGGAAVVTCSPVDARCDPDPRLAVMVVLPELSSSALPAPSMLATAGSDDLHCTGAFAALPFNSAVNSKLELLSCRGLLGETVSLSAATDSTGSMKTNKTMPADHRTADL